MKVSAFYGKQVESAEGKLKGWVCAVLVADGAPQFLKCFDKEDKEFEIDIKNIISAKEKIIFEDRSSVRSSCKNLRLGIPAYSQRGKFLGYLSDAEFGAKGVTAYIIGRKKVNPTDVKISDVAVVRTSGVLKEDVKDENGVIILKKNSDLTDKALEKAQSAGEYIQARLKAL